MPSKHALLSPSASDKWTKCAGMPKLASQVPYQASIPAVTGTLVHEISEVIMKDMIDGNITIEDYWLGKVERVEDFEIEVDQEMIDCAKIYTDFIKTKQQEMNGKLLVEEQISIHEITDSCWGTADAIILGKDHLCVVDLKSGKWPVSPENNYQLMIYGLGHYQDMVMKTQKLN